MRSDCINDEIRRTRHDLAARFGNDLDRILADIRKREASDGRTYVSLLPRPVSQKPDEQNDAREPSVRSAPSGTSTPPAP